MISSASWHYYLMAFMYIIAGIFHFVKPKAYLHIMPRYFPNHKAMVFISGIAEVLLGIGLLFTITKNSSIYLIAAMLVVFFTVHIHMLQSKSAGKGIPKWVLWLRIPLQFILIWWALFYV